MQTTRCMFRCLIGAALTAAAMSLSAQEKVLKAHQVTESALIDALEIEGPPPPDDATTRGGSFRRASVRPGGGKASLLITFATDSAELAAEARSTLDTVARALQSDRLAGFFFRVEGHADPRGAAEHNQKLSQSRAEAVVNYLVAQHGILQERLRAIGKGSSELMDPRRADAPENRRVTLVTSPQ